MLLIIYPAILTYNISCLRVFGPLPRPLLTNPNPLHHPRVLPARNGQCRIHARPEQTRPLTGADIEVARRPLPGARVYSAFKGRNSRPQYACKKLLGVRATASYPPPTHQSLPIVLVLHGAIHRQAGGKVIVYSVCGVWHAERLCGVEPWRVRHERDMRDLNVGFARWRNPTKINVGFSLFPFFLQKNGNFPLHFHSYSKVAPLQHSIKYKGKVTRMLMHLNDSHIIDNIYFTTKDKSCESVYERNITDGVTTT